MSARALPALAANRCVTGSRSGESQPAVLNSGGAAGPSSCGGHQRPPAAPFGRRRPRRTAVLAQPAQAGRRWTWTLGSCLVVHRLTERLRICDGTAQSVRTGCVCADRGDHANQTTGSASALCQPCGRPFQVTDPAHGNNGATSEPLIGRDQPCGSLSTRPRCPMAPPSNGREALACVFHEGVPSSVCRCTEVPVLYGKLGLATVQDPFTGRHSVGEELRVEAAEWFAKITSTDVIRSDSHTTQWLWTGQELSRAQVEFKRPRRR